MAPFENNTVWEEEGIIGARRFVERVWRLVTQVIATPGRAHHQADRDLERSFQRTIQRVTADLDTFKFNTAIAALMECLNELVAHRQAFGTTSGLAEAVRTYVLLLAPFAPYLSEELWSRLGMPYSVHQQPWPAWDEGAAALQEAMVVVQVDGRVRDRLTVPAGIDESQARERALGSAGVQRSLQGRSVARVIYVPGRLINLVTTATG